MSPKYRRMVLILGTVALFLIFMLYFYQAPFVHFWVTYIWYPFKAFVLNPKTGWIVYGLIGPLLLLWGFMIATKKWLGWEYNWITDCWTKIFKKKKK